MTKTIRLVKVSATTANMTKGIINYLIARGHYAFRVNTVGIWDPVKKLFRRPNTVRGVADILCCLNYKRTMATASGLTHFNTGLFLAIEIKNTYTRDRSRKAQEVFSAEIAKAGGLYIITRNYWDFIEWYEAQEGLNKEVIL